MTSFLEVPPEQVRPHRSVGGQRPPSGWPAPFFSCPSPVLYFNRERIRCLPPFFGLATPRHGFVHDGARHLPRLPLPLTAGNER